MVFTALLTISGLFMIYLGTMASAFYLMSICLFLSAYSMWMAWQPKILVAILYANQATAGLLILLIAYRKIIMPYEDFTLSLSGLALIGNRLSGGPFMGLISVAILGLLAKGTTLPQWLEGNLQEGNRKDA